MTSISGTEEKKRWCVTGTDDGSKALLEVKRVLIIMCPRMNAALEVF
jgi:hypothetical protein